MKVVRFRGEEATERTFSDYLYEEHVGNVTACLRGVATEKGDGDAKSVQDKMKTLLARWAIQNHEAVKMQNAGSSGGSEGSATQRGRSRDPRRKDIPKELFDQKPPKSPERTTTRKPKNWGKSEKKIDPKAKKAAEAEAVEAEDAEGHEDVPDVYFRERLPTDRRLGTVPPMCSQNKTWAQAHSRTHTDGSLITWQPTGQQYIDYDPTQEDDDTLDEYFQSIITKRTHGTKYIGWDYDPYDEEAMKDQLRRVKIWFAKNPTLNHQVQTPVPPNTTSQFGYVKWEEDYVKTVLIRYDVSLFWQLVL